MLKALVIALVVAVIVMAILLIPTLLGKKKTSAQAKRSIKRNLVSFGIVSFMILAIPIGTAVYANTAEKEPISAASSIAADGEVPSDTPTNTTMDATSAPVEDSSRGLGFIAAALATGIACLGAGIAVGGAAPAAIGAVSEDPKSFGKAIIFVVLGEGVAIYGLVISILILLLKMN